MSLSYINQSIDLLLTGFYMRGILVIKGLKAVLKVPIAVAACALESSSEKT